MDDTRVWATKHLNDFLRQVGDQSIVTPMIEFVLGIEDKLVVREELDSMLGVSETTDLTKTSLFIRQRKLDFIDEYVSRRWPDAKPTQSKKRKGVKIKYSQEAMMALHKDLIGPACVGKQLCYCMGTDHELVGNCLACGKVVCALEGKGACLFCGHAVTAKGEKPLTLPDQSAYAQAVEHKDKLLNFNDTAEQRQQVIDDSTDWFEVASNPWISEEDRATAAEKAAQQVQRLEESKNRLVLNVDLASGTASTSNAQDVERLHILETEASAASQLLAEASIRRSQQVSCAQDLDDRMHDIYDRVMAKLKADREAPEVAERPVKKLSKLQHEDPFADLKPAGVMKAKKFEPMAFNDSEDSRQCLSMHQPWASLVVLGFKRVEGRQWTTDHRGPLWIHAASRRPTAEEIAAVEDTYRRLYGETEDTPPFPERYPTGVLLGRVELVAIDDRKKYIEKTPEGLREEGDSSYVFVVKNPLRLLVPIKMPGGKNIFTLDRSIWEGAKQGLRRVYTLWWPPQNQQPEEEEKAEEKQANDVDMYL